MNLLDNEVYYSNVTKAAASDLDWDLLKNQKLLISGGTGMIGSFLIDILMYRNIRCDLNCQIYCMGRSRQKAETRFIHYLEHDCFHIIEHDVRYAISEDYGDMDYIMHLAGNTSPLLYATRPIETIEINFMGLRNLLEYSLTHHTKRTLFASSVEIYGENKGDTDKFDEQYCGYIDPNTLRADYSESKRCAESLCHAYIEEKKSDIVIARLSRIYGPTMSMSDSRAISQFLIKGIKKEDIELKSKGDQLFSYCYVSDAALALLAVLLKGKNGEAYNIANEESDITLYELAQKIADIAGVGLTRTLPSDVEKKGYSKATKALLDSRKLEGLGWKADVNLNEGISYIIDILR